MSTDVTDQPAPAPGEVKIAWWTRGDLNAFFGLGFNILVNVLTLTTLMIGVIKLPADDVLGTVLPALGVAVRRLHDVDRSGWWILITLIPLIEALLLSRDAGRTLTRR